MATTTLLPGASRPTAQKAGALPAARPSIGTLFDLAAVAGGIAGALVAAWAGMGLGEDFAAPLGVLGACLGAGLPAVLAPDGESPR